MPYAIAKPTAFGDGRYYVRSILRGGLSIDNYRVEDGKFPYLARKFRSLQSAEKALEKMQSVGGFDDYKIFPLEEKP